MKKFKGEISTEVEVTFESPEKASATFIHSEWKDCFWEIDDLKDLASNIANALYHTPSSFKLNEKLDKHCYHCSPEGFGDWVQIDGIWVLEDDQTGKISVELPDAEPQYFNES